MESLPDIFKKLLSPDQETRQEARRKIELLKDTENFGMNLTEFLVDPSCELLLTLEESPTAILIDWIEMHWCSSTEEFQPPEIASETKHKIKELLLLGAQLAEFNSQMRHDIFSVITFIIPLDSQEFGLRFYNMVVDQLTKKIEFEVPGKPTILSKLDVKIDEINLQEDNIVEIILLKILRILEAGDQYKNRVRMEAVDNFTMIFRFLSKLENNELNVIRRYLDSVIPLFYKNFAKILQEKCLRCNVCLKASVMRAITELIQKVPKYILDSAPEIFPPLWQTLIDSASGYRECSVFGSGYFWNKDDDFDVEELIDYNYLVTTMLEFIETLMSGPEIEDVLYVFDFPEFNLAESDWFHLRDSVPINVLRSLIIFLEATITQIELWTDELGQFIEEEELERRPNFRNIRGRVRKTLCKIVESSGKCRESSTGNALTNLILTQLTGDMKAASQTGWKQHEAFLSAFCRVKTIIEEKRKANALQFDIANFLEDVVLANLNNSESHSLVICQCLRVGREYIEFMPLQMKKLFLDATFNCLEKNQPMFTRMSAANSAYRWFENTSTKEKTDNTNELRSYIPVLIHKLLDLGNELMSPEVLGLIVENFAALASLDKASTASEVNEICKLTVAALYKFHSYRMVYCYCWELFTELMLNPECTRPLQEHLIPALVDMMIAELSSTRADALLVLEHLLKNWPEPLEQDNLLIKSGLPALFECIFSYNDWDTLFFSTSAMEKYLSVAALQVIEYEDIDGKTGSQYILQIASHLLNSENPAIMAKYAFNIVAVLIKNKGKLAVHINETLKALINTLRAEWNYVEIRRRFLMLCALLLNSEFDASYKYLSNASGRNEQSAFGLILYDGFCKEYEFFNPDEREVISLALTTVLNHGMTQNDSKLHEITVQEGEAGMETTVPLLVGISKFITNIFFSRSRIYSNEPKSFAT